MSIEDLRKAAQRDARSYLEGSLSWDEFITRYGEVEDELVSDLVDIIEHEPKRGGLFGLREAEWNDYARRRESAIQALDS